MVFLTKYRYIKVFFHCNQPVLSLQYRIEPLRLASMEWYVVPKNIPETELIAVVEAIRLRPEGAAMSDLAGAKATDAQRRSMQRRLKKLQASGRIRAAGTAKSTRYFLPGQPGPAIPPREGAVHPDVEAGGGLFVPISVAGQHLQALIGRPKQDRPPVGYRREFLSGYQPNATSYLTPRERQHLAKIGAVELEAGTPAGTHARHILDRLLIDLSWNSSRLEGNTYSILDTHILLEQGRAAEGKSAEEAQMILNHKDAIEFIVETANEIGFNRHTILNIHALLSNNLIAPDLSGRLRQRSVGIGGSSYSPLQTPAVIDDSFSELLGKAAAINDPFEQSFFVAIQLPYLQPFVDVNKRVSRLAANIPFIKSNLSPVSFIDVPDDMYAQAILSVYELNKTELARDMFVWAYERSARTYAAIRQSIGQPDPFKMRYREKLRSAVAHVVQRKMQKTDAARYLDDFVKGAIPAVDCKRFVEAAETELLGLHEGNFARYRIRPSEFFAWKAVWEASS
jgi:Fic/DOC family